jgi:hypothetical protein
MKLSTGLVVVPVVAFLAMVTYQASAATYTDTVGDATVGGQLGAPGSQILDITSVEVNNNATDLIFKINLNGDPVATDWGKYMVAIDSVPGGDTTGNGWVRPISMSSGMDYWIGSWVDSGNGAQLWTWSGSWNITATPGISKDSSSVTLTLPLASMGLSVGNSFVFDVYTSGGGGSDGAVDALGNPNQTIANWSDAYNSAPPYVNTYTVVPEPSTIALVAIGGLMLVGRLFRRRA